MKGVLASLVIALLYVRTLAFPYSDDSVITTDSGKVRGFNITVLDRTVTTYLGIPYSVPPVGERRFLKPLPVRPWDGILEADTHPNSCMQPENFFQDVGFEVPPVTSEDCLYLNIWAPPHCSKCPLRPVLVWIHGGAFVYGSASQTFTNGSVLAAHGDVIVVAMNYRLGVLGFLTAGTSDTPGNMGLLDQNLALRWIRNNIRYFGGDPESVTLFGESAGSVSVNMHLLSPLSRGLFKRAVMQSGFLYSSSFIDNHEHAILISNQFAEMAGCADDEMDDDLLSDPDKVMKCLRSKSAQDLIDIQSQFSDSTIPMKPTYENEFLPKNHILSIERGDFYNTDILVGSNSNEGTLFLHLGFPQLYPKRKPLNVSREETISVSKTMFTAFNTPLPAEAVDSYFGNVLPEDYASIREKLISIIGDRIFVCPGVHFAGRYARRGNSVYYYNFSHRTKQGIWGEWMGVPHTDEIQYVFGMPLREPEQYSTEDTQFAKVVMSTWIHFAKTGKPIANDTAWPAFTEEHPYYYNLNPEDYSTGVGLRQEQCRFWKRYLKYPPYFGDRMKPGKNSEDSGSLITAFTKVTKKLGNAFWSIKSLCIFC